MKYGYNKITNLSFDDTVNRTITQLSKEGFGVLTEIDIKEVMKKKLDIDYEEYLILGACNPKLADRALKAEKEIGLFLPCNVIIYKIENMVFVSAILPRKMMGIIKNRTLDEVAGIVEGKLKKVIDSI